MKTLHYICLLSLTLLSLSCDSEIQNQVGKSAPDWSTNAVIYEVNVRQYSPEGTFDAVTADLDRLKDLGVEILWLMPIHPIGELNRKGSLGSYYAVKDYLAINPEFGSEADLQELVRAAHERDMKVILDWVANHTSWDNHLTQEHPEWFTRDENGEFVPPVQDWSDVIDLDFEHPELRAYMVDALKYWVTEFDIDGYRCDVAGMVPTSFWDSARVELDKIKPVFMLAEAQEPEHQIAAFDMSYGWDFHHVMNQVALGEVPVSKLDDVLARYDSTYPPDYTMMMFTSNHDENSWNGTAPERMGDGLKAFAALSFTVPGMPMIYNGQESKLDKRLEFFEKDPIAWGSYELQDFYSRLAEIKEREPAFWHGHDAGSYQRLASEDDGIFAFTRSSENSAILCVFNFSESDAEWDLPEHLKSSLFYDLMTSEAWSGEELELEPWGFQLLKMKED